VRLGHKTREARSRSSTTTSTLTRVRELLADIGYDESRVATGSEQATLVGFYVASGDIGDDHCRRIWPRACPRTCSVRLERVDAIPLTVNGKVDEAGAVRTSSEGAAGRPYRVPEGRSRSSWLTSGRRS
jgi:hypothetical protein